MTLGGTQRTTIRGRAVAVLTVGIAVLVAPAAGWAQEAEKPNILVIWGDDIGQLGKNHLGDQDEHLPTNHGFDVFFGNLYRLNAEEEPENEDYPG